MTPDQLTPHQTVVSIAFLSTFLATWISLALGLSFVAGVAVAAVIALGAMYSVGLI